MKTSINLLALCLIVCLREIWSEVDWCSLPCSDNVLNTMCEYKPHKNIGNCKNIEMSTTPELRKELLALHNEYRDKMANGTLRSGWPQVADMRQMSWDYDLEKLALRWLQQCSRDHDKCRRTPNFVQAGQNKATPWNPVDYTHANSSIHEWVNEIDKTFPVIIDQYVFKAEWGHFSQVIWAKSFKLGCAEVHFSEDANKHTKDLLCNYGVMGNRLWRKMYTRGPPCNACPTGMSCREDSDYPHLCALPTDGKHPHNIPEPPGLQLEEFSDSPDHQTKESANPTYHHPTQPRESTDPPDKHPKESSDLQGKPPSDLHYKEPEDRVPHEPVKSSDSEDTTKKHRLVARPASKACLRRILGTKPGSPGHPLFSLLAISSFFSHLTLLTWVKKITRG